MVSLSIRAERTAVCSGQGNEVRGEKRVASGDMPMNSPSRILVVDDEKLNRNLLQALLKSLGYAADVACDGVEALEKASQGYDMVLLDAIMPGIDGFETTRRIRKDPRCNDIPIIIATGMEENEARTLAIEVGASDCITKPVVKAQLEKLAAALLKGGDGPQLNENEQEFSATQGCWSLY
jgi:CheY-like chemotaxis protein